jgi:hypothetical protein
MLRALRSLSAVVCALASASSACGGARPEPCSAVGACGEGQACIVGRCRPNEAELAPLGSERVVLAPTELVVLEPGAELEPGAVTPLGALGREHVLVLLRFDPPAEARRKLAAAFLVFERDGAAPPESTPIELELAPVLDPWSTARLSWASRPRVGSAKARFTAPAASDAPLRIEVTELLEGRPSRDHGFALRAVTSGPSGVRVVTGPARGEAPRLELYFQ